jgi:hypothetical protein
MINLRDFFRDAFLATSAWCLHSVVFNPEYPDSLGSYLAVRLDVLEATDVTVKDLLEIAATKARLGGADKLGFRGIAIVNRSIESTKVSIKLVGVPFGIALGFIANLTQSKLVERQGLCSFHPGFTSTFPDPTLILGGFEVSPNFLRLIERERPTSPTPVRTALESLGIVVPKEARLGFSPPSALFVELPADEMEVLRVVLLMLDRGVLITTQRDANREKIKE